MGLEEIVLKTGDETLQQPISMISEEDPPKLEEILTDEIFQSIVKGYNPELSLTSWKAQLGTKPGDNYMSIMYAVEMELKGKGGSETLNVMLKTVPRSGYRVEMINEIEIFRKEAIVYKDILSLLEKIQDDKRIPKKDALKSWPRCYNSRVDGYSDYLAMEDLNVLGYKMGNRKNGLNYNHCALVLQRLAKFHAISYVQYEGNQEKMLEDFPVLINRMFGSEENKISNMQKQTIPQTFKMLIANLKELGEDLAASRLQKITDSDFIETLRELLTKKVDAGVITHGDFWVNNMLFKYKDNDTTESCPTDAMFIDFQLCQASSRMIDVFYFLLTSVQVDVLKQREEDLLMIYYSEFTSFVERLGGDISERKLNWMKLLEEANDYRFYGICMGIFFAPIFAAEVENVSDLNSIEEGDFKKDAKKINSDEATSIFVKEVKEPTLKKVKYLLTEQLSKWSGSAPFL